VSARSAAFVVCLALSAYLAASSVFWAVENPGKERPKLKLDAVTDLAKRLEAIPLPAERGASVLVAFVGDSMLFSKEHPQALPSQVEGYANRQEGAVPVAVHELAIPGSGAFDYYFAADGILAREPDLVVIEFNLTSLSETWRQAFARPTLAGLVSLRRIPETLMLPISWTGLTADRVFAYALLMRLGLLEPWTQLELNQVRTQNVRFRLFRFEQEVLGSAAWERYRSLQFYRRIRQNPDTKRFSADRELDRFGAALSGIGPRHPVLRALGATVEHLRREGTRVFVYVNPANVEHLSNIGLLEGASLDATLASIQQVVSTADGRYADLHSLLPDAGFRDAAGHFTGGGPVDGLGKVARAIARVVREEAERVVALR
jgi:hypothetical protein